MALRRVAAGTALDLGGLLVALEVASLTVFGHPIPWVARVGAFPMLAAIAVGAGIGLIVTARPAGPTIPRPSYGRALTATVVMFGITATALVFLRPFWSRRFVLYTAVVWLGLGLAHRFVRRRRPWTESMVVISAEKSLVDHLVDEPHSDVVLVLEPGGEPPTSPPELATALVVDLRAVLSDQMARFVSSMSLAGYSLRSLVSVYEEHTGRLPIVHLMEGWELTVPLNDRRQYVRLKRLIDTVLIVATAVIWVPVALLIAVVVRFDSPGPVIYRQRRVGLDGRPFTLHKFRTMRVSTDNQPRFASKGDDRLTRFGRVLRLTRMDELPQLWNVLRGDLSLVGPRPEQEGFAEQFTESIPFYGHRHLVRPGVTGWAQVNFGYADNEAGTIEKLSYDLYYVKHVSMWMDLEILGRSIWTVLSGHGAR